MSTTRRHVADIAGVAGPPGRSSPGARWARWARWVRCEPGWAGRTGQWHQRPGWFHRKHHRKTIGKPWAKWWFNIHSLDWLEDLAGKWSRNGDAEPLVHQHWRMNIYRGPGPPRQMSTLLYNYIITIVHDTPPKNIWNPRNIVYEPHQFSCTIVIHFGWAP